MDRRGFLAAAVSAPAILGASSPRRSYADISKLIESGDVKGKLSREDVPTPSLMLDLDAFEANVAKMTQFAKDRQRALRPHGKTHKCPEIAKALIQAGAGGCCAAKISEAEVFAKSGVRNLLVTTAVIGKYKIERAVTLASKQPETIFSVDNAQNVRDLNDAAALAKVKLHLAIDLLVGNRTGISPGDPALGLAQAIEKLPNVKLAGLQAYAGHCSHVIGFEERKKASLSAMAPAVETRRLFEKHGIACPLLTGGSTGTYNIDSEIEGMTELQPGSFMFMDVDYGRIGGQSGPAYRDFRNSLTVLTTVVSKPDDQTAVVDGGFKAFSTDKPFGPEARDIQGLTFTWGGDEHGKLNVSKSSKPLNVGDHVEFIIPHCDPSVNLYDRIYCTRGDAVQAVWRIAARGMSQ